MKNKKTSLGTILNYLIVFLVIGIAIVIGLLAFGQKDFIKQDDVKKYTVTIMPNGALINGSDHITCEPTANGCSVVLPFFSRQNGEVIGYNLTANDTTAHFKIGERINLENDLILYAISSKKNTVTIFNDYDYIDKNEISCVTYNNEKTCQIELPRFNKIGYQNIGYSTGKETFSNEKLAYAEYVPGLKYNLSESILLYPKYEAYHGIRNVNYIDKIGNVFLESGKDVSNQNVELYKRYLREIYAKAPYLFNGTKITLLSENVYNSFWSSNHVVLAAGITYNYSGSYGRIPLKNTIDLKTNFEQLKKAAPEFSKNEKDDEYKYKSLIHEMVHSWDSYYSFLIGKINPNEISAQNADIVKDSSYYHDNRHSSLSSQADIKAIYNTYSGMYKKLSLTNNTPNSDLFSTHSLSNEGEFIADAFACYYLKYIVPTGKYANAYYPDDLKRIIEKYICIAKNNYNSNGCS